MPAVGAAHVPWLRVRARALLAFHDELVIEHRVAVEHEAAAEALAREEEREPERVVGPHLGERDRVERRPERDRLRRLGRRADEPRRPEHHRVERVAVDELKRELAVLGHAGRRDTELLLDLADGARESVLVRLDATAGAVHLARTEPALLADEEDAPF